MENVITFTRCWYLIQRTTNSAGIRTNWINCVLCKVLLNLHIFPVLNTYCTEPYPVQRSYVYLYWQSHGPLKPIKIIVQVFWVFTLWHMTLIFYSKQKSRAQHWRLWQQNLSPSKRDSTLLSQERSCFLNTAKVVVPNAFMYPQR